MDEAMTKQDAIETLEIFRNDYTRECSAICRAIDIAIDAMRQPTIEADPVRHGRWIVHTTWHGMFGLIHSECSECKFDKNGDLSTWKFCPNCGRDMRAIDTEQGGQHADDC